MLCWSVCAYLCVCMSVYVVEQILDLILAHFGASIIYEPAFFFSSTGKPSSRFCDSNKAYN